MKQFKCALCTLIFLAIGCKADEVSIKPPAAVVGVLIDKTDSQVLECTPRPILALLNCAHQPDSAAWIHLSSISSKKFNEESAIRLPSSDETERANNEDPQARKRVILKFYDSTIKMFNSFYVGLANQRTGELHSEIFAAICRELQWIKDRKCSTKSNYLIAYSDLLEHSELANSYKEASAANIDALVKKFENTRLMPDDLAGFTIFIVHISKTDIEDAKFSVMQEAYQDLLVKRGAKLIVQTNNQNYLP